MRVSFPDSTMDPSSQSRPQPPKAAGLTNILNNEDQPPKPPGPLPHLRDSGFYSNTDISSKRETDPSTASERHARKHRHSPARRLPR